MANSTQQAMTGFKPLDNLLSSINLDNLVNRISVQMLIDGFQVLCVAAAAYWGYFSDPKMLGALALTVFLATFETDKLRMKIAEQAVGTLLILLNTMISMFEYAEFWESWGIMINMFLMVLYVILNLHQLVLWGLTWLSYRQNANP